MTEGAGANQKKALKGGVRGGARFPKQALDLAVGWSNKLVSKTHSGPQPSDIILSGVFGSTSTTSEVKASTLRQFGLLDGAKAGYFATELAKKIKAAPAEDLSNLYKVAALHPPIFKSLFDTFHGDEVSRAKIKQRLSGLKVHPDATDDCAETYANTMVFAGLAVLAGDQLKHSSSEAIEPTSAVKSGGAPGDTQEDGHELIGEADGLESSAQNDADTGPPNGGGPKPGVIFHVNVTLDSSLDSDKLANQLKLLKGYGVI